MLITLAIAGVVMAASSLFRVGFGELELAWQANLPRVVLASAAGAALAVGGARFHNDKLSVWHTLGFIVLMLVVGIAVVANLFAWPWWAPWLMFVVAATITWSAYTLSKGDHALSNLVLGLILLGAIVLSVLNYAGSSVAPPGIGSVANWLMGDLSVTGDSSYLVLAAVVVLILWCGLSPAATTPYFLMLGLAVGAIGPVLFVSYLVPRFTRWVSRLEHGGSYLITCGFLGAFALVIADSFLRFCLGGFAPPIGLTVAMVSAPSVLWINRVRLLQIHPSVLRGRVEAALIIALSGFGLVVLYHIVMYARSAT